MQVVERLHRAHGRAQAVRRARAQQVGGRTVGVEELDAFDDRGARSVAHPGVEVAAEHAGGDAGRTGLRGGGLPGRLGGGSGGGTTDYAVEIFYEAIKKKSYTCFLESGTTLPMMYMPDAIRGTIQLAETDFSKLKNHSNFNFAGISFSCAELADEIKKHIPDFKIDYAPDFRQQIANSWPRSIDDSEAKKQWGWKVEYDLEKMTKDMILNLKKKLQN
jgi:nucleoside-diphosphate-sugar epimerase